MTVESALFWAKTQLSFSSDEPRVDAERLALHILNQSESAWLYAHGDYVLTNEQRLLMEKLVAERISGKPLAYILGEWDFYGRPFIVTTDVLIPRPKTEELISAALKYINIWQQNSDHLLTIADIGTGCGCIAVTLALELRINKPESIIVATDLSLAALAVARRNAERHGVLDSIDFRCGDMLAPLAGRRIDLIVSNPPYVPSQELAELTAASNGRAARNKTETRGLDFEPRLALDGGPDGQQYVEQIKNAGVPALVEITNGQIIFFEASLLN